MFDIIGLDKQLRLQCMRRHELPKVPLDLAQLRLICWTHAVGKGRLWKIELKDWFSAVAIFFEARSPKSAKSARHRLWKLKCHTALWDTTVKGFPLLNLIGHCWLASCRHTVAYPAGPAPKHLKHFELITSSVFWKDDSGLCPWL